MLGLELVVVVSLVAGGAFLVHRLNETSRLRRALRRLPRVPIGQAAERQLVRLEGQVLDGESLRAPLTGRRCVFYVAVVEEWNGKINSWRQRVRETRGVFFALSDGTGKAIVDASCARVDVQLDSTTESNTFDDATPVEEAFLERHGMQSEEGMLNRALRYREGVVVIGERIAIAGRAVREPDPQGNAGGGYRDGPATRLRVGGSKDEPLLLSDSVDVTRAG